MIQITSRNGTMIIFSNGIQIAECEEINNVNDMYAFLCLLGLELEQIEDIEDDD